MTQTATVKPGYPDDSQKPAWRHHPFDTLRKKWGQVPSGLHRRCDTADLLQMNDTQLLTFWRQALVDASQGTDGFATRGWYHTLYQDVFRGKKVMDVGSGLGLDGITFALSGAQVTFVDIVESNLQLLQRVCGLVGADRWQIHYMPDTASLAQLPTDYDVIWCQGSLINAPRSVIQAEVQELVQHLKIGGRWIELAYPRERWIRDGSPPFEKWGQITDGPTTPYMEWYDLDKLRSVLAPAEFDVILAFNYHQDDYNWFDLIRRV